MVKELIETGLKIKDIIIINIHGRIYKSSGRLTHQI
jgi:hypothetical protein